MKISFMNYNLLYAILRLIFKTSSSKGVTVSDLHHSSDPVCGLCEFKLAQVYPYLVSWFNSIKKTYPLLHVSSGYRGQEEQDALFNQIPRVTHDQFPKSPHNKSDANGNPQSLAIDLFTLDMDGCAQFPVPLYTKIAQDIVDSKLLIRWGGSFITLRDYPHYEVDTSRLSLLNCSNGKKPV